MSESVVKRFWFPRGDEIALDEAGFLYDPEHELLKHANPSAARLPELRETPCLVLLGEAGLGKSTDLEEEVRALVQSGGPVHAIDLGLVGTEEALVRQAFGGPAWEEWRKGKPLTLFLDALDECRVSVQHAAQVLVRELRALGSIERLRLRVACRPGAWPEYLDERLQAFWPGGVEAVNLAPLRRQDAGAIARSLGVADSAAFLNAVLAAEAGPLATSPLTLRMLARLHRERGRLPSRRFELYEEGCLALCTEQNPSRRAARRTGEFSGAQRRAVAGRLAALTILCGKAGVWLGAEALRPGPEWLTVADAAGGTERAADQTFAVTETGVREALQDTALFAAAGAERLRWAHRSYAEFLAARHLLEHQVPLEQLRQLLWHPAMPDRIVPQLLGVAGWLGRAPGLLPVVCATDPQALFRTDLTEGDDDQRRQAVEAVLRAVEAGRLDDTEFDAVQYRRLSHRGLAVQLRPVIVDKGAARATRCLALDLARVCCANDMQGDLAAVALDEADQLIVRGLAASTLCRAEDPAARARLRPLLDRPLAEDTDDDLKGYALRAAWPGGLTAEELFTRMTPPKQPSYFGAYSQFVHDHLLPGLRDDDLPVALRWMATLAREVAAGQPFKELCNRILVRAWDSPRFSSLVEDLARAIWTNIARLERSLGCGPAGADVGQFGEGEAKRRELLAALLRLVPPDRQSVRILRAFRPQLVRREDVPWLLGRLDVTPTDGGRATLVELLMQWFTPGDRENLDRYLEAAARHPDLQAQLDPFVAPVELGFAQAEEMRRVYERNLAEERVAVEGDEEGPAGPTPQERIRAELGQIEAGEPDAWCELVLDLSRTPAKRFAVDRLHSGLTTLPGWQEADEATRGQILSAAEAFVRSSSPRTEEWFGEDRYAGEHARAGFKALRLLREEASPVFDRLEDAVLEHWLPALLTYPSSGEEEDDRAQRELLAAAYRKRPEPFLERLRQCVLRDNAFADEFVEIAEDGQQTTIRQESPTRVLRPLSACFDDRLAGALRALLADPAINATVHANLLEFLVAHQDQEAVHHARDLLAGGVPVDEPARRRYRSTLQVLLDRLPMEAWPVIRGLAVAEPELCRSVLGRLWEYSATEAAARLNAEIPEQQVAELYRVLTALFFPAASPSGGAPDPEDLPHRIRHFRSELLRLLCARGTFEAVTAVEALGQTMPEMRYARLEAERRALEDNWDPPEPSELTSLIGDSERRLVRSGEELLTVIAESISRFERELQGETPLNFTLWDERSDGVFRPKDEERLSDAIKRHLVRDLKDRGLIAHREVQIRSKQGRGAPGEETDIHVDVLVRPPGRDQVLRIRVIIEVKGCWHADVLTAMETQLRDRYLRDNDCRHGLYVVGWFICPQWDRTDRREGRAHANFAGTREDARQTLEQQGVALSTGGVVLRAIVVNAALR